MSDSILSSPQAEAGVLSILIFFPNAYDTVADRLTPELFADDLHRLMFHEVRRQILAGRGIDVLTVADALRDVADMATVHSIATCNDFGARGLVRLVDSLVESHQSRQLYALSHKLHELAFSDAPVQERIDQAASELSALQATGDTDEWVDAYTASMEHSELIERRHAGEIKGIATGISDLDRILDGGVQRGNLVVIGARPGMGKSAIALSVGLYVAQQYSVGFFSLEMPHADVRDRMAAILGRVAISDLKQPAGLDYSRLVDAIEASRTLKFHVSDKSGLNILQVRSRARALQRKQGLDMLMIDYLGLMPGVDAKMPRAYQIEQITTGLKSLAKELGIVVVILAQVNRGVAERADQTPGLADLRDSGAIEQDADVVAFVNRPIVMNPNLTDEWKQYALMRVAKNRQGRLGDVHLHYQGEQTRFSAWGGEPPTRGAAVMAKKGFGA